MKRKKFEMPLDERGEQKKINGLPVEDFFYKADEDKPLGPIKTSHFSGEHFEQPFDVLVRNYSSRPDLKPEAYKIIGQFEGTRLIGDEIIGFKVYEVEKLPRKLRKEITDILNSF